MSKTGFWRRIFGQSERPIPWDIRTVTAAELSEYPNGISDIQMQRFDGFLIKNVASAGEIKQLLDGLARVDEAKKHSPQAGMGTYPEPFFSVSIKMRKGEEVTEKVDKWVEFERDFPRNFGFDFFARLTDLLEKMSGGKQVKFPIGLNGISQMIPGNFRELAPGLGEIKVHSGNQFLDEFADIYTALTGVSEVQDQLSYFLVLQNCEAGGDLVLFDLDWEKANVRHADGLHLESGTGKVFDLTNPKKVGKRVLRPEPGDLVLFAGGQIWHEVTQVSGTRPRITLGGFLSKGKDGETLHIWS